MNKDNIEQGFNLTKASHPILCLLHIGLKFSSCFAYLFLDLILTNSVDVFITIIWLLAVDFWFVKNVSGRYLVGMRWWNGEDETEQEGWYFESFETQIKTSFVDKTTFWWSLIISTVFWGIIFFVKLMSLSLFWGILVFIGLSLNATNLYGYYLCKKDHDQKVQDFINNMGDGYANTFNLIR